MMKYSGWNRRAFTLVELMIVVSVLAILAAMVIPKFTDASVAAQSSATLDTLRRVRVALERYKMDHDDQYPAIDDLWDALTEKTDRDGNIDPAGDFGPYLKAAPENPFTGSTTVADFGAGTANDGWEYDVTEQPPIVAVGFNETTGEFTSP